MRRLTAAHRDLLLGAAVVALMSVAYASSGEFPLSARDSASSTSIVPVVDCVAPDPANPGSYIATFGYERTAGTTTVRIPYASAGSVLNFVDVGGNPLPPNYGVPTEFRLGSERRQFAIRALDSQRITWALTSDQTRAAVATRSTLPVCSSAGQANGPGPQR